MDDALAQFDRMMERGSYVVLILVVMDDALALCRKQLLR